MFEGDEVALGDNAQTDELTRSHGKLPVQCTAAVAGRCKPRKVPQSRPPLAWPAFPQQDILSAADDNGDFGHIFVIRSLGWPGNLCNELLRARPAKRDDRAFATRWRSRSANFAAQLHQRLIELGSEVCTPRSSACGECP